jgi:lysophospholipase L1-like esterase
MEKNRAGKGSAKLAVSVAAVVFMVLCVAGTARASDLFYHLRMDGNVPKGAVLFIGDSITEGLCVAAVADRGVNYGIGGDTTTGVLQRIPKYKSIHRVKAVVLAIGVNDLWKNQRTDEQILESYRMIFREIPAKTTVVFSAILPIDEELEKDRYGGNARIKKLNVETEKICRDRKNCVFVDSGGRMTDAAGNLKDEFHIGDGLHLATKGYDVWIEDLSKALDGIGPQKK